MAVLSTRLDSKNKGADYLSLFFALAKHSFSHAAAHLICFVYLDMFSSVPLFDYTSQLL